VSDVGNDEGQEPGFFRNMMRSVRGAIAPPISGLKETEESIKSLNTALDNLQRKMEEVNRKSSTITTGITQMLGALQKNAAAATSSVNSLAAAVSQVGGGVGGGPVSMGGTASPAQAVQAAQQTGSMRSRFATSLIGAGGQFLGSDLFKDIAMYPLRFMRERLGTTQELALTTSMAMGGQAFATGVPTQRIMQQLAGMPGSVLGSPEDLMALMGASRQYGAMLDFSRLGGRTLPAGPRAGQRVDLEQYTPRAAGFFQGVRQMQMMTPGVPVGQLAATLGEYAASTGAQQAGAYLTGGAYAMIGTGGRQKSLQEWAESILRWLEGLRPGRMRGKPFKYGELMSQYFPGSNIDAWFAVNGVPPNMREYWWTYALAKARTAGTTGAQERFQIAPQESDLAFQRLRAGTAETISSYNLAGKLAGAFANREQANRWFNEMLGQVLSDVIPAAMARGPLRFAQAMPTNIEELLMTLMERGGIAGTVMGGLLGYGGAGGGVTMFRNLIAGVEGVPSGVMDLLGQAQEAILGGTSGDVGDVGDFGPLGGTTTAGLHPDMRRKVNAMLKVNPKLRVASGLRDLGTQQRLRRKGYSRVSGRPSAHTRGMAADLGPPSEYPWIIANAQRFGLKSGVGQGEPWHVGIGDDGPANLGILKMFMDLISGGESATPTDVTGTIGQMVPAFFNLILGVMGKWGAPEYQTGVAQALQFRPTQYAELVRASKDYLELGGLVPSLGGGGGGRTGGVPTSPAHWPSPGTLEAGAETARLASIWFHGDDLARMVAISKRESQGWNPMAHNAVPPDDSYGLWQINMLGSMGPSRAQQLTSLGYPVDPARPYEELYDPATNARAMKMIFDQQGWGAWTTNRDVTEADMTEARQAMRLAGVGDVDYYMAPRPKIATGTATVFNNNFVIQGGAGPNMGIDARRVAALLANHLEEEMRKRMARMN
jgi:Lysozyme like domain